MQDFLGNPRALMGIQSVSSARGGVVAGHLLIRGRSERLEVQILRGTLPSRSPSLLPSADLVKHGQVDHPDTVL